MRYGDDSATGAVNEWVMPVEYIVDSNGVIEPCQVRVVRSPRHFHVELASPVTLSGSTQ